MSSRFQSGNPVRGRHGQEIIERVFWVPPEARWQNLQNQAARAEVASLIDDAIDAVAEDCPPRSM
jgi:type I restriction-modification system DNA methylase subunit